MTGMKILLILGLATMIAGATLTWGPLSTGAGLLVMLCSLPLIFLGLFLGLIGSAKDDS